MINLLACKFKKIVTTVFSVALFSFSSQLSANPQGGTISSGSADIIGNGNKLDVYQYSDKAIIDWRSFNIAIDEHTQFHQPGSSSIALNRIHDVNPSQILGKLTANGQIILINPNGVFFGKGSIVDVGGITASTADINNKNFLDGKMIFDIQGNPNAQIINKGNISVRDAGIATLVAPQVINAGVIKANMGKVNIGSADMFTLDLYGDGLIEVALKDGVKQQLIENSGLIQADGGEVYITAAAANDVVNSLIDISGEIKARGGKVSLIAKGSNRGDYDPKKSLSEIKDRSTVIVSGIIDVSDYLADGKGGHIKILGDNVGIVDNAILKAEGTRGGGSILIGGGAYGAGDNRAISTYIGENVKLIVNSIDDGDGGKVVVWSDDSTRYYGSIEAKGGINGGDGGFAEVSGNKWLDFKG